MPIAISLKRPLKKTLKPLLLLGWIFLSGCEVTPKGECPKKTPIEGDTGVYCIQMQEDYSNFAWGFTRTQTLKVIEDEEEIQKVIDLYESDTYHETKWSRIEKIKDGFEVSMECYDCGETHYTHRYYLKNGEVKEVTFNWKEYAFTVDQTQTYYPDQLTPDNFEEIQGMMVEKDLSNEIFY